MNEPAAHRNETQDSHAQNVLARILGAGQKALKLQTVCCLLPGSIRNRKNTKQSDSYDSYRGTGSAWSQ